MNKPVWRMNNGNGIPSDLGVNLMYPDGTLAKVDCDYKLNTIFWEKDSGDPCDFIHCYETNRVKVAKYDRVDCYACEGDGHIFIPVAWSADELREKCLVCNGKGHTLEKQK